MTYGPALKWRFPFQERIDLKRPDFRIVFISLCVAAALIFFISFSYYNAFPFASSYGFEYSAGIPDSAKDSHEISRPLASSRNTVQNTDLAARELSKNYPKSQSTSRQYTNEAVINKDPESESIGTKNVAESKDSVAKVKVIEKAISDRTSSKDRVEPDGTGKIVATSDLRKSNEAKINEIEEGETIDESDDDIDLDEDYRYEGYEEIEEDFKKDISEEYAVESVSQDGSRVNVTLGFNATSFTTGFQWNDTRLDILHMRRPEFDHRFQNPCWYEPLLAPEPYENNSYIPFSPSAKHVLTRLTEHWTEEFEYREHPKRLRCLPYFLLIGQPKCGTTSLFWKIAKHPDIEAPPIKELHWWSRSRQGRRFGYRRLIPFEDYVDMFDEAALNIGRRLRYISDLQGSEEDDGDTVTQIITGEASVSLFWDNTEWMKFPENRDQTEPLYIVPHYLHHMLPDIKLILMLRDPVERMFSDYLYFHSTNKSAEDFHSAVTAAIVLYNNCTAMFGVRHCIYDTSLANKVRVRLRVGMYSVYLKDWLKLFSTEQFYVLRLEDYSRNPQYYVKQIYRFLHVREITKQEEELVAASTVANSRKPEDQSVGGMLPATRKLLGDFYQPYNLELAQILKNTKYLWKDVK